MIVVLLPQKSPKVSFSRRGQKSRPTLWVNNCLRKTKKNKKSKNKLTGTGNNSAGRQEFFDVNVIFQIDNLHDSDNQLPQQQQRQFQDRAHASKPLQKCKSLKVRQASIICKGVYPHTKERTPSSPSPFPPPPQAPSSSHEPLFRASMQGSKFPLSN